jgi:hypothetical protein
MALDASTDWLCDVAPSMTNASPANTAASMHCDCDVSDERSRMILPAAMICWPWLDAEVNDTPTDVSAVLVCACVVAIEFVLAAPAIAADDCPSADDTDADMPIETSADAPCPVEVVTVADTPPVRLAATP